MAETKHTPDGGPAFGFATMPDPNDPTKVVGVGMTLRDWFSGQALAGLLASNAIYGGKTDDRGAISADAYQHADAMIAERSK